MRTARGMATGVIVAMAVGSAGCTNGKRLTPAAPTPASTSASALPTPSATPTPTPTPTKPPAAATGPNAKYANEPAVQTFFAYVKARHVVIRRRSILYGPYLRVTTRARQRVDASGVAMVKRRDLTLRGNGYYIVQRLTRKGGNQVLLRLCQDDDEAVWHYRKSGKVAFPVANRWLADEVRVVRVGGTWKVHSHARKKFTCKGELRS